MNIYRLEGNQFQIEAIRSEGQPDGFETHGLCQHLLLRIQDVFFYTINKVISFFTGRPSPAWAPSSLKMSVEGRLFPFYVNTTSFDAWRRRHENKLRQLDLLFSRPEQINRLLNAIRVNNPPDVAVAIPLARSQNSRIFEPNLGQLKIIVNRLGKEAFIRDLETVKNFHGNLVIKYKDFPVFIEFLKDNDVHFESLIIDMENQSFLESWPSLKSLTKQPKIQGKIVLQNPPQDFFSEIFSRARACCAKTSDLFQVLEHIQFEPGIHVSPEEFLHQGLTPNEVIELLKGIGELVLPHDLHLESYSKDQVEWFLERAHRQTNSICLGHDSITSDVLKNWHQRDVLPGFADLDLTNCRYLNTDILELIASLPSFISVTLPHLLDGQRPLPDPLQHIKCYLVGDAALAQKALDNYIGPQEYTCYILKQLYERGFHPTIPPFTLYSLDPASVLFLIRSGTWRNLTVSPNVKVLHADLCQELGQLSHQDLRAFLAKFPNLKRIYAKDTGLGFIPEIELSDDCFIPSREELEFLGPMDNLILTLGEFRVPVDLRVWSNRSGRVRKHLEGSKIKGNHYLTLEDYAPSRKLHPLDENYTMSHEEIFFAITYINDYFKTGDCPAIHSFKEASALIRTEFLELQDTNFQRSAWSFLQDRLNRARRNGDKNEERLILDWGQRFSHHFN